MIIGFICAKAAHIKKLHGETDPERLCRAMGIRVMYEPMGDSKGACKGFYLYRSRQRVICVNSNLPERLRRAVLAHELGHAVLHNDQARLSAFHDFSLYDNTGRWEYEANLFAAELLLDDREVLELLNTDRFFFAAAEALGVAPQLLDFKFRILKNKGCKLAESPITATGDFLKHLG
jgi:Zn-dependent peptidase ImmA (M78 family)